MFCVRVPSIFEKELFVSQQYLFFGSLRKKNFWFCYFPNKITCIFNKGFIFFYFFITWNLGYCYTFLVSLRFKLQILRSGIFVKLLLTGVGFRVFYDFFSLNFSIGFCSYLNYGIENNLFCLIGHRFSSKLLVSFFSVFPLVLSKVSYEVLNLKKLNPYKERGFRFLGVPVSFKVGKRL